MENDTNSVFVVVNDKVAFSTSLRNQQTSLIELLLRCLTNANIHKQQYSHADTIRKG